MQSTRPAAVAGMFYPGQADELAATVDALLDRLELCVNQLLEAPACELPA